MYRRAPSATSCRLTSAVELCSTLESACEICTVRANAKRNTIAWKSVRVSTVRGIGSLPKVDQSCTPLALNQSTTCTVGKLAAAMRASSAGFGSVCAADDSYKPSTCRPRGSAARIKGSSVASAAKMHETNTLSAEAEPHSQPRPCGAMARASSAFACTATFGAASAMFDLWRMLVMSGMR